MCIRDRLHTFVTQMLSRYNHKKKLENFKIWLSWRMETINSKQKITDVYKRQTTNLATVRSLYSKNSTLQTVLKSQEFIMTVIPPIKTTNYCSKASSKLKLPQFLYKWGKSLSSIYNQYRSVFQFWFTRINHDDPSVRIKFVNWISDYHNIRAFSK